MPAIHKGALHVNEAATLYDFRHFVSWAPGGKGGAADDTSRLTWGKAYVAGVTGIEVVTSATDNGAGVQTYQLTITFVTGWHAPITVSLPTWLVDPKVRLHFDNAQLVVGGGCSFTFSFDQLDIYIDEILFDSIGPQSESGTGFDLRKDCWRMQASAQSNTGTVVFGCLNFARRFTNCSGTFPGTGDNFFVQTFNTLTGGYRWWDGGWVEDDIAKIPVGGTGVCLCDAVVPSFGVGDSNSYHCAVGSDEDARYEILDYGNVNCPCICGDLGVPAVVRKWAIEQTHVKYSGGMDLLPKQSGLLVHHFFATTTCGGDPMPEEWTATEDWTYVACDWSTTYSFYRAECYQVVSSEHCSSHPPFCGATCPEIDEQACCVVFTGEIDHPNPWQCPGVGRGPWSMQDPDGRLHLATVFNGDVQYSRSDFSTPPWAFQNVVTSVGDVTFGAMALDRTRRRVWLVVERDTGGGSHSVSRCFSDSDGRAFTGLELLVAEARAVGPWDDANGAVGFTWFEYDAGTAGSGVQKGRFFGEGDNAMGGTFTFVDSGGTPISVADGGWSDVRRAQDNQGRLTWCPILDGETEPSVWRSFSRAGASWERVI